MRYLKCTKKVLDEIGIKTPAVIEPRDNATEPLGDWCVNLLRIQRKKCLLMVNEKTLFSILVPEVKKSQIQNIAVVFREALFATLIDEEFTAEQAEKILSEYDEIGISKTTDRSVLGSMNDYAYHYKDFIESCGGFERCRIPALMMHINKMPMGARNYAYAIDLLKEACKTIR
jgi:hypothetical protein